MKSNPLLLVLFLLCTPLPLHSSFAADNGEIEAAETEASHDPVAPKVWSKNVQEKYQLSDDQMKKLEDSGVKVDRRTIGSSFSQSGVQLHV